MASTVPTACSRNDPALSRADGAPALSAQREFQRYFKGQREQLEASAPAVSTVKPCQKSFRPQACSMPPVVADEGNRLGRRRASSDATTRRCMTDRQPLT